MRRYVEALPNVSLRCGFRVERLITSKGKDGVIDVTGVDGTVDGVATRLTADIVVDTSGKGGRVLDQLISEGAPITEEKETAGILYFTRHYRLLPGQAEPDRKTNPPASGDLGYIKFGVFPGDGGNFSITLAVPEIELKLRESVVDPDIFHAITLQLPGLYPWTNAERSEATSKVVGMGDLVSRWRDMVQDGKPAARGFFALGDTLVRTNPLYGRGCSFAAVSAQSLRRVLDAHSDPMTRAIAFHKAIHKDLRPFYLTQRKQDRSAIKVARNALIPGYQPRLRARLAKSFLVDGIEIAIRSDTRLLREALRGFHMLEHPEAWLLRPRNLAGVLYYWARGKKRNAAAYRPKPGPEREEFMQALQLDHRADMDRVATELALAA
jgi:flavin-dependent dehydrogenase